MYDEHSIELIRNKIQKDFGFKRIIFEKEVVDDLFFKAYDINGVEDQIRVKPEARTVFTWVKGRWRLAQGYKI